MRGTLTKMSYQKLLDDAGSLEVQASSLRVQAEEEKKKEVKKLGVRGWLGYQFESSSVRTPEYAAFERDIKKELKKLMTGYELIDWLSGHFEFSSFFKSLKTGRIVYISCSDVRFWPDEWFNNLLIRTAKDEKDYTGGSNDYASLPNLKDKADVLTK